MTIILPSRIKQLLWNVYVGLHGIKAMNELITAVSHQNSKYRNAALRMSLSIPEKEVVVRWLAYFPKAIPAARPELINMFGLRADPTALPLVISSLSDSDVNVRKNRGRSDN